MERDADGGAADRREEGRCSNRSPVMQRVREVRHPEIHLRDDAVSHHLRKQRAEGPQEDPGGKKANGKEQPPGGRGIASSSDEPAEWGESSSGASEDRLCVERAPDRGSGRPDERGHLGSERPSPSSLSRAETFGTNRAGVKTVTRRW